MWARPADPRRHSSDAEELTTVLVAAHYFGGGLVRTRHCLEQRLEISRLVNSDFINQLHYLVNMFWGLPATFGQLLRALQTEACYVIGSFPVAVCHNVRIGRDRLLGHEAYRDRCASKRSWGCGFKVRIVATTDGVPVDFYVHTGSEANVHRPAGPGSEITRRERAPHQCRLRRLRLGRPLRRSDGQPAAKRPQKNSWRPHQPAQNTLIQNFRKTVEPTFS